MEYRHSMISEDIKFDYNRFNPKRNSCIQITKSGTNIECTMDVHFIQVAYESLRVTIDSKLDNIIFNLDFFILPFDAALIQYQSYEVYSVQGSAQAQWENLFNIISSYEPAMDISKLHTSVQDDLSSILLNEIITDPTESRIIFKCKLIDGKLCTIILYPEEYKLTLDLSSFL